MNCSCGHCDFGHGDENGKVYLQDCIACPDLPPAEDASFHDLRLRVYEPEKFITTAELASDANALVRRLPPGLDAVVCVTRSGLLPGTIIATRLHLPMYGVSSSQPRRGAFVLPGGLRMADYEEREVKHVLLVDDTVATGHAMEHCLPVVKDAWPAAKVTRAVVYCHPDKTASADVYEVLYGGFHWLEWNWISSGIAQVCGVDFDGILCEDIVPEDDDDGPRYRKALENARPLHVPRFRPVPIIVTARHERYRDVTEAWLRRHGALYERLVMRDWDYDSEGGDRVEAIAEYKAAHVVEAGLKLFAESEPAQAISIARWTGGQVLCPALGKAVTA